MKTAKYAISAITIICPTCGQPVPNRHGSLYHTDDDCMVAGDVAKCPHCGKTAKIPAIKHFTR
jgi:endogenous inhibitor of DNA gyrase (YacG/DUF329 family)